MLEVEKVVEKSNSFITTLYFNYLGIYTCGVATKNQTSKDGEGGGEGVFCSFVNIVEGLKLSTAFTKTFPFGYCFVLATQLHTF